jgi:hypothetical protein
LGSGLQSDVLRNARRIPKDPVTGKGGNPVLVYSHGGGATLREKKLPWIASGNGNPLAYWCNVITDPAFDVISIGRRQASWDLPLLTHPKMDDYGWRVPTSGRAVYRQAAWDEFRIAILAIKSRSDELGIDPDKIIVMGTSYGADVFVTFGCTAPLYSGQVTGVVASRYGIHGGYDSSVAGVIPHQVCCDFRNTFQERPVSMTITDLVYTDSDRRLTLSGAFVNFLPDVMAASGTVRVTAGTGAFVADYQIDYVDPAGAYIVVDRSLGAGADGQTDITITYNGYPQTLDLTGCTWDSGTLTLTKTDAFKKWGHTGKNVYVRSGNGQTSYPPQGVYRITGRTSKDAITLATSPGTSNTDYSVYISGDPAYWAWFKDMFGAYAQADWDAIPRQVKRSLSALYFIETGQTEWWVPMMVVSEKTGNALKPYGITTQNSDPHDSYQVEELVNAARAKGLECEGFVPPGGWDDSDPLRDTHSQRILNWMKRITDGVKPRQVRRGPLADRLTGTEYR